VPERRVENALENAYRLLSYRPRSRAELERRLRERGFDGDVLREVVERLERDRLVDDRQFARLLIEERSRIRPSGRARLAYELGAKGVPKAVAKSCLDEALPPGREAELALAAAESRLRRYAGVDPATRRRRLAAFLRRRGFAWDAVRTALRGALGCSEDE